MKQLIFQTGCQPFYGVAGANSMNSTGSVSLLARVLQGCAQNDSTVPVYIDIIETEEQNSAETDSGAVMYIVAVLVFYSAGIVTMIVKYLRREKRELEEERILEDFFRSMPAYKKEREQNNVNRVAIHAFHALTSFSYDDADDDIDSSDEDELRVINNRAETIHEVENEHYTCSANVTISEEKEQQQDDSIDQNTEVLSHKEPVTASEELETII